MSGSSLDGLDLAYCEFSLSGMQWNYSVIKAETIGYDTKWLDLLKSAPRLSGKDLIKLHHDFGEYLGNTAIRFLKKHKLEADLISSHGHTIFHQPESGFTFQLGEGQAIATASGMITINDFRTKDIQLGGQGAPLVPLGDEHLFGNFEYCLNIGGIANISFKDQGKRYAFDICAANQVLNHLAQQLGKPFDEQGNLARSGKMNIRLLEVLNTDPFYHKNYPKSMSNQYVQNNFNELLDNYTDNIENKLRTVVEHIAIQISNAHTYRSGEKMLVTGGGALNTFLMERLKCTLPLKIIIPDRLTVDFKEAIIFAFLGVLRQRNEINCLSSVTGARKDSCCGVISYP